MNIKLLTEDQLEFLSLKEGYIGSSESTLVYTCQNAKLLEITCRGYIFFILTVTRNFTVDVYRSCRRYVGHLNKSDTQVTLLQFCTATNLEL